MRFRTQQVASYVVNYRLLAVAAARHSFVSVFLLERYDVQR